MRINLLSRCVWLGDLVHSVLSCASLSGPQLEWKYYYFTRIKWAFSPTKPPRNAAHSAQR